MNNFILTINRECGTGGRTIALKLSEKLGIKMYDRKVLDAIAEKFNMTVEQMEELKSRKVNWWSDICKFYQQFGAVANIDVPDFGPTPLSVFNIEKKLLLEIAEKESCIIVGRAGFHIFRHQPNVFHILLIGDMRERVRRISRMQNLSEEDARQLINNIDASRDTFIKTVADTSRYDARHYDLVLNVSNMEPDVAAGFLADIIQRKMTLKQNGY